MARGPFNQVVDKKTGQVVLDSFAGGLETRTEPTFIDNDESPDVTNMVFDGEASIQPRLGNTLLGVSTSAGGYIRSTWRMQNVNLQEMPLRMVVSGTGGTAQYLEYYNPQTAAWENLESGYTPNFDFGHEDFNFRNYWISQKDYMRRWNGIAWSTSTYADSAYARIDLSTSAASALGFLSAGFAVVDGESVYYSSINGTALSGITFTKAHNGGVAIAQAPSVSGEAPASDGGWVSASSATGIRGGALVARAAQLYIANASGVSGNVLYWSAVNEPTNFAISSVAGGGGTARYPETLGGINTLTVFDQNTLVMKRNSISDLKFNDSADNLGGILEIAARADIMNVINIGSVSQKSTAKVENDVVYVTPTGWIRGLTYTVAGQAAAGNISQAQKTSQELSLNIRPSVESFNMTSAAAIYYTNRYYLACATSGATFNNQVLVYDYNYKAWTKFVGWNVGDWFIYNNNLHFGASNEIATYRALINYDDNGLGYDAHWTSKVLDFGTPGEQKEGSTVYIDGYLTTNTSIGVSAYFDNSPSPYSKSILGTGSYVSQTDAITTIGYNTWGTGSIGGSTGNPTPQQYTLYRFRVWARFPSIQFFNMQLKLGTQSPGYVYKINHVIPYIRPLPGVRIPPSSII